MVWAITIAIFLGTVFAALSMFLLFSRREQILKALREKRKESRIPMEVSLELSTLEEPFLHEKVVTKNTSRHGARVVCKEPWRPKDHILVSLPRGDKRSRARVAYCNAMPGNAFAIGLRFSSAVDGWATFDISNEEPSGHYQK